MPTTTVSSRQFNQDVSSAKRASCDGPVMITDRGEPAHVLLSIEEYRRITEKDRNILDLLAMPDFDVEDEFDAILEDIRNESRGDLARAVDFD